ncbi:peroxide stress protein YaaA [Tabrizicola oligotrophica]|uniref:UPF0246 protein G4Z14_05045 n=1 Tax=Tabrizicola oligotrophica TaxID=2710650 RepID=A0A6M0QQA7_9RHOB|nr:peroxide stress protein YaaA [Tabrizicola oligotrophica]NEY89658.1 peroxide stress protein YaaA [Tabrizicola oligotrophica]
MLTVISPAKRLNEKPHLLPPGIDLTVPEFLTDAARLATLARGLSARDLCALMDISPKLGDLNRDRFAAFDAKAPGQPAAFLFDGDTYAGLEARRMESDTLRWAQGHLRILSGLYGLLRPLDGIQPYRLEMGARLANPKGPDLYHWWGKKPALALKARAAEVGAKVLVNCASAEYFGAVDVKALGLPVLTPVFLEEKAGEARIVSFWAKKARGAMARFIAENHLTDAADLRGFSTGGYAFAADQSDDARLVFRRPAPAVEAA